MTFPMTIVHSLSSLLLASLLLVSLQGATVTDQDVVVDNCPLWLAESHTSSSEGFKFGVYAGKTFQANDTLPNPELAIPLIDLLVHNHYPSPRHPNIAQLLESHVWTSEFAGTHWEANEPPPVAIPGLAVLAQYHSGLANIDHLQASVLLLSPQKKKRATSALSRGAVTPYANVTFVATQSIPLGMELFSDFGDVWDGNYTDDAFQDKFIRHDYEDADEVIKGLVEFYKESPADMSLELQEDILDFVLDKVLGFAMGKHAKTIKSLIPANPRYLQRVLDAGGSFLYRYPDMIKSPEWLRKNGMCLTGIKEGTSDIPDAGRGAFATMEFAQGETLTISPMLHIADKDWLDMYADGPDEEPTGQQLLLNYCFGHPESSLLLFPLGSGVTLINHGGESANAYLTWTKQGDKGLANQNEYQDVSVEEVAKVKEVVFVMKVVAKRNIAEGEEITIDYGPEWESAFNDYQTTWDQTAKNDPLPLKADDFIEEYSAKPLETVDTLSTHPYPENVLTACFINSRDRPDGFPMIDPHSDSEFTDWFGPSRFEDFNGLRLFLVDVLDRVEAPGHFYNYTIRAKAGNSTLETVFHVPHSACTFVNRPYTSDIHMPGAFRHPIGILENHFPQKWRDLR